MSGGRVRIWDLPTRVFHWGLAGTFVLAWLTRGDQNLHFHLLAGYLFTGLLLFRVVWGFAGGQHSRFRAFLHRPAALFGYLMAIIRGSARRYPGHNPAGSWAVYLMLALGVSIGVTGIITLGAEERHGPLAGIFGFPEGAFLHSLHEWLAWAMLALVALHLAGVLLESLIHHENLPGAMITGFKPLREGEPRVNVRPRTGVGLTLALFALLFSLGWLKERLLAEGDTPYIPFAATVLPRDPGWQSECGDCHLAYHPTLLPARSWRSLLAQPSDHFGEDLSLDSGTLQQLLAYATANAAEQGPTEAAWKILDSIPENETPLRITRTPYWLEKHRDLREETWKRPEVNSPANCNACHLDAEQGGFEDGAMHLP